MTVKRVMPQVSVRILRSPDIGVIGVGESTTQNVPNHIFQNLGIGQRRFYALVEPTWKLGIHFLWGPRQSFEYALEPQLDVRFSELPRPVGYYCDDEFSYMGLPGALMSEKKAFSRQPNGGGPVITPGYAFHFENAKLVNGLEVFAREFGVEIIDGKMQDAERGPKGITAIVLDDGRRLTADFFIDASGFRSELLGRVMEEPYISYGPSLFNDRVILGSWERTDEPILPYTTAETMDAGWAWRIEHEHVINRGYVHCGNAISEDNARAEFARKNSRARIADRVVKFRTGRYRRGWVDNVMAVGNSCGFVEPLESTSLMVICWQLQTFVELIRFVGPSLTIQKLFNRKWAETWDEIRDFLALHFWANTRIDTPYWRQCRADTYLGGLGPLLEFYRENGPSGYCRHYLENTGSQFGLEGFLIMFVGNRVPRRNAYVPTEAEWNFVNQRRAQFKSERKRAWM